MSNVKKIVNFILFTYPKNTVVQMQKVISMGKVPVLSSCTVNPI